MVKKVCIKCGYTKEESKFDTQSRDKSKRRNVCNSCKYKSTKESGYLTKNKTIRSKQIEKWKSNNPQGNRFRSMRHSDKRRGHIDTMNRVEYDSITSKPCYYCGRKEDIGVDRIDNTLGHTLSNSLPCCHKCNYLLSDLPMEAKEIMKESLTRINNLKIIDKWVVPTKRKKKSKKDQSSLENLD